MQQPDRWEVIRFLEAVPEGQSSETWARRLAGYLDGLDGFSGSLCVRPEILATACRDYLNEQGRDFSPPHFRAFVRRVIAERSKVTPIRAAGTLEDRIAENARGFLADRKQPEPAA
jgi:hypothetical protein